MIESAQQQEYYERQINSLKRHLDQDILGYLEDANITEILYNSDGYLWLDHRQQGLIKGPSFNPLKARLVIETLASLKHTQANSDHPILECELPNSGERFEGVLPPIVTQPIFSIRKPLNQVVRLADYVAQGIMTLEQQDQLIAALHQHDNILVVGGTGSGKTTLTHALLQEIQIRLPQERLILLEDTRELKLNNHNVVALLTQGNIHLSHLVKTALRLRPDRIIVGEVRGAEALALLKAWNTGHPGGISTLHANDARGALLRLEQLIEEAGVSAHPDLIAHTVDLIVVITKTAQGRLLSEVMRCHGHDGQDYCLSANTFFPPAPINLDLFSGDFHVSHDSPPTATTINSNLSVVSPLGSRHHHGRPSLGHPHQNTSG